MLRLFMNEEIEHSRKFNGNFSSKHLSSTVQSLIVQFNWWFSILRGFFLQSRQICANSLKHNISAHKWEHKIHRRFQDLDIVDDDDKRILFKLRNNIKMYNTNAARAHNTIFSIRLCVSDLVFDWIRFIKMATFFMHFSLRTHSLYFIQFYRIKWVGNLSKLKVHII